MDTLKKLLEFFSTKKEEPKEEPIPYNVVRFPKDRLEKIKNMELEEARKECDKLWRDN